MFYLCLQIIAYVADYARRCTGRICKTHSSTVKASKNLRFFKFVFRFLVFCFRFFLGFNVGYAQSHAVRWTQEYDQEEGL